MDTIALKSIPISIYPNTLAALLKIDNNSFHYKELVPFLEEGVKIARPKAIYKPVFVEERGENFVVLDGVKFHSRVLAINLNDIHRAFPFVVTCGIELEEWADSLHDAIHKYWAEGIMGIALVQAIIALDKHIKDNSKIKKISHLSPGSIDDWQLEEQASLFKLLGDVETLIGVKLTGNNFMVPAKTVSGMKFPSQFDFESCMLCEREACIGRRARFNKEMWEKYFEEARNLR